MNGWHFADDIFKCILFNENNWILIEIQLRNYHIVAEMTFSNEFS